jgi:hypothetical protein
MGISVAHSCKISFLVEDGRDVCRVEVPPAEHRVYVDTDDGKETFYIRRGNATSPLGLRDAINYVQLKWPRA